MNLSDFAPPLASLVLFAVLGLAYALACTCIAHRFTRVRPDRRSPHQSHPQLREHAVQFAARDGRARIDAWYLPAEPRQGAVILVHGKATCRGDQNKAPSLALAERLRDVGMSVLLIDLRGHGSSSPARLSYGWHERHDVLGAVDFLLAQGYAPGRIGVLGVSLGAGTAALAAADEPAIGALVLDSAFASFEQMLGRQFSRLSRAPGWFLPGTLAAGRLLLGVDVRRVQPLSCMPRLRGRPVLVIHSQGDRFVPATDAHALATACGGECWRTDSEGHSGSYRALPLAYEIRVASFFARHLDVLPPRRHISAHLPAADARPAPRPVPRYAPQPA
ncbi:MAG: alpha/beta hydrolase [Pseudorhodoferax sp.]